MGKFRTIDSFFKNKNENGNSKNNTLLGSNVEVSTSNERPSKSPMIDLEKNPSRPSVVEVELEKIHLNMSYEILYITILHFIQTNIYIYMCVCVCVCVCPFQR